MHDIKDKIIADLRHELDTARAVIRLLAEQQQRDEERHEHELREAKRDSDKLHRLVDEWKKATKRADDIYGCGSFREEEQAMDAASAAEEALRNA